MRIVANTLAGVILLVTLSYSIMLADEINTIVFWDFGVRTFLALCIVGPLATLAIVLLAWAGRCDRIPAQFFLLLNAVGLLLLSLLLLQTLTNDYGLWLEKTINDRHFSNSILRYYLFPPYVGATGIYLAMVSYLSYRKLSWLMRPNVYGILCRFIGFMPIAGYYALIIGHQWISKPYFIG